MLTAIPLQRRAQHQLLALEVNDEASDIKNQLKVLSPLRDTQVQVLRVQNWVYSFSELYKYYHYLIDFESRLIPELRKKVESFQKENINSLFDMYNSIPQWYWE